LDVFHEGGNEALSRPVIAQTLQELAVMYYV
jgi:hypothetical protein